MKTTPAVSSAMRSRSNSSLAAVVLAALSAAGLTTSARAAQITWQGNVSGNLSDSANWVGGVAPASNTDGIALGAAGLAGTSLTQNANVQYSDATNGALLFTSAAPSYTISGNGSIMFGNGGIVQRSTNTQTINNNIRRNTSNFITIGANNTALVLNGTVDLNGNATINMTTAFGTSQGSLVNFANNLINSNASPGAGGLTLSASVNGSGLVVLSGNNTSLNGTVNLGNNSWLKLANVNALGANSTLNLSTGTLNSTLWLANDTPTNNLTINATAPAAATSSRVLLDRATAGAAFDQSIAFAQLGQQVNWTFQKGGLVTSGTANITATGNTVFGNNNSAKTTVLNPIGVDLSLGSVSSAPNGAASITSILSLDGTSTGNKVTGAISNGVNTGTVATATIASSSGNVLTMTAAVPATYIVGMTVSGSGIPTGTVITAISGTTMTLSQTPTSPTGVVTGTNVNVTSLAKAGSGTWALQGANAYTGTTSVNAGVLNLDFANSSITSDILYNNPAYTVARPLVSVGGGTLQFTGKPSTSNTQALGSLASISSTAGKVVINAGAGGTLTVNATAYTANTSSIVDFTIGANATLTISSSTNGSFFGNRATVNGSTDFAWINGAGGNVIPAGTNITTLAANAAGGSSTYATLTGDLTRTANGTIKGYRIIGTGAADGTLDLGGFQLNAAGTSASTILYAGGGTNVYNIVNGTLGSSTNANTEFDFAIANGANLRIASTATFNDAGFINSILKVGDGTLTVLGAKNYTGVTRLLGGSLSIDTLANGSSITSTTFTNNATATPTTITVASATGLAIGQTLSGNGLAGNTTITGISGTTITLSANATITNTNNPALNAYTTLTGSGLGGSSNAAANLIINGGTIRYIGTQSTPSTDRSFTLGFNGATIDASGANPLTWAPASSLSLPTNAPVYFTLTGNNTGLNTFGGGAGIIADGTQSSTTLVKNGPGTWVLAGANTFSGGTIINQGNLTLTGTETAGTSGPLGKAGDIVFAGGTLQFSATNVADYSYRIKRSAEAVRLNTNGQNVTFSGRIDETNTKGLAKLGAGTLTLSGVNSYTGNTTVESGTLALSGNLTSSVAVNTGANLQFTLGVASVPVATTTGNLTLAGNSTVTVIGTPAPDTTYTLLSANGVNGTPVLSSPIAGFSLVAESGSLKLKPTTAADTTAPAAPSVSLLASSDTGSSGTDRITKQTTPTLRVTLAGSGDSAPVAGDVVKLFAGATQVASATLGASDITAGYVDLTSSTLTPGVISFTATVTDAANNVSAASAALAVTLDTTAPVITRNGSASVSTPWGSAYSDAGATASDNVDASVTVVTVNPVVTSTPGTYTVTYNATDVAGNIATSSSRSVTVAIANASTPGADGLSPLLKYAFGATSPTDSVQAPVTNSTATELKLTAVVRTNDANLAVSAETNTDLDTPASWTTTGVTEALDADQTNLPAGCVRKVYSVTMTGAAKKFLRIKAASTF